MFIHFLMAIVCHILLQGMFSVLCFPAGYEKMSKIVFKYFFLKKFEAFVFLICISTFQAVLFCLDSCSCLWLFV